MRKIDKEKVKKILFITLSNVGDVILTTPVLEVLAGEFPDAVSDILVGPQGKDVFMGHERVREIIIYDKKASWAEKFKLFLRLLKNRYDMVVDLRNTVLPIVLFPKYKTNPLRHKKKKSLHKKDIHLSRVKEMGIDTSRSRIRIPVPEEDRAYVDKLLCSLGSMPFVILGPGAKSHVKRWPLKNFAKLADNIKKELSHETILIGDDKDKVVIQRILFYMKTKPINFIEKTNIRQLAYLIKKAKLLITNDSAPLHAGSAVGAPILAFFGPTDEKKYGPAGNGKSKVLRKNLKCAPCEVAQCVNYGNKYECLNAISVEEAFRAVKELLGNR